MQNRENKKAKTSVKKCKIEKKKSQICQKSDN